MSMPSFVEFRFITGQKVSINAVHITYFCPSDEDGRLTEIYFSTFDGDGQSYVVVAMPYDQVWDRLHSVGYQKTGFPCHASKKPAP